jgi:threonine dehydrogenase-like Zn-dependent dehydrogenase
VVVGGGIIGLLVAYLAARLPGASALLTDVADRSAIAAKLGIPFGPITASETNADIVFHTSASPAGLATAISAAGFEGTIVELSWYGDGTVAAPLGGAFHSQRLKLISSQVGHVSPSRRPRWNHRRRLESALSLLQDPALDILIGEEIAFADAPALLPAALAPGAQGLPPVIRY